MTISSKYFMPNALYHCLYKESLTDKNVETWATFMHIKSCMCICKGLNILAETLFVLNIHNSCQEDKNVSLPFIWLPYIWLSTLRNSD